MKRNKIFVAVLIIALIVTSFSVGSYVTEQKNHNARTERCCTLITFAIDKAENSDLTDDGVMKGLISNVYAAYQYCDEPINANRLHDLWNYLIFESEDIDITKEIALRELNAVLDSIKATN